MANCTGSTLSKHNTGLTHTAHCTGSSAKNSKIRIIRITGLVVAPAQHSNKDTDVD